MKGIYAAIFGFGIAIFQIGFLCGTAYRYQKTEEINRAFSALQEDLKACEGLVNGKTIRGDP